MPLNDSTVLEQLLTSWPRKKVVPGIPHRTVVFNGEWMPSEDPVEVATNFVSMKNLYYGEVHPVPARGMTKLSSTVPLITSGTEDAPVIKAGIQYINERFDERCLLVQAANADDTLSSIIRNTSDVPTGGDFSATELYAMEEDEGRFARAPNNSVLFCDGERNLIWGGTECPPVGVINKAEDGSYDYNYTDILTNSLDDSANTATIHSTGNSLTTTALTVMHFEGTLKDECYSRNITNHNGTFNRLKAKVDHQCLKLDRDDSAYFTIPDSSQYNFAASSFTLSRWVQIRTKNDKHPLFYQYTNKTEDYMLWSIEENADGDAIPIFKIEAGNSVVVSLTGRKLRADKWYWLAVVRDVANNMYYLLEGDGRGSAEVVASSSDANAPANYTSDIYVGVEESSGTAVYADMFLDELQDFNEVRFNIDNTENTITAIPPDTGLASITTEGYATGFDDATGTITGTIEVGGEEVDIQDVKILANQVGRIAHVFIVSNRPIDGVKWYVPSAYPNEQLITFDFRAGLVEITAGDVIVIEGCRARVVDVIVQGGTWGSDAYGSLVVVNDYLFTQAPLAYTSIYLYDEDIEVIEEDGVRLATVGIYGQYEEEINYANVPSTVSAYYWGEDGYVSVGQITDETNVGGIPLYMTGWMTFESTVGLAKQTMDHGVKAYHYKFVFSNLADNVKIYQVTLSCPMQEITDIWDGEGIQLQKVWRYDSDAEEYHDYTVNSAVQDYQPFPVVVSGTVMEVAFRITYLNLKTFKQNDELLIGSQKRLAGVIAYMADNVNNTANTILTGWYFGGNGWVELQNFRDGTQKEGTTKSFAQTGYITWDAPAPELEFKTRVKEEPYLYYYRLKPANDFNDKAVVDCLMGIPAEQSIKPYKFPVGSSDVIFLCNNMHDRKNAVRPASPNTATVWKEEMLIGDERALTAGCCIPSPMETLVTLMYKVKETWSIRGRYPKVVVTQLSSTDGCPSPKTVCTTTLPIDIANVMKINPGVAIWQGVNGIYISDGGTPIPVHWKVRKYFDENDDSCIPNSMIGQSIGWIDERNWRYHLRLASGSDATELNTELVLDFRKMKWSEVSRGTKNIQYGMAVEDAYGNMYQYGFDDDGYMLRLDYGMTFDGEDITCNLRLGDIAPAGNDPSAETTLESIDLLVAAKQVTENNLEVKHYLDTDEAGTGLNGLSCKMTGKRLNMLHRTVNKTGTYHGIELSMSVNDETEGLEPFGMNMYYQVVK